MATTAESDKPEPDKAPERPSPIPDSPERIARAVAVTRPPSKR